MEERKHCSKCYEYKLLGEFHKANDRPMGVKSACKQCNKSKKKLHYQNNKEKYKKSYDEFIFRNPGYNRDYYLANIS